MPLRWLLENFPINLPSVGQRHEIFPATRVPCALTVLLAAGLGGDFCATCTSGDVCNDLKTGALIGASPRSQQMVQIVGVSVAAFVLAQVMAGPEGLPAEAPVASSTVAFVTPASEMPVYRTALGAGDAPEPVLHGELVVAASADIAVLEAPPPGEWLVSLVVAFDRERGRLRQLYRLVSSAQ